MFITKKIILSVVCSFLVFTGQSNAAIFNITDSGNLLATLGVTQNSNTEYLFELSFLSNGGSANFSVIDLLAIDSLPATQPTSLSVQSTTGTVTAPTIVGSGTTTHTSFNYDYGFAFAGSGDGRFQLGEAISWTATYASGPVSFDHLGVVFVTNGGAQPKDVFAVATPVPEPQAYMMFFAGLGLMGFLTRHNRPIS